MCNHADNRLRYLLRDYEDDNGNTVLCLVAGRTDNPQMLSTLLRELPTLKGVWDRRGRTPLMEAALWGRVGNVQVLLANGVTQDLKDRRGRSAIDLAIPNRRNARERYLRRKGSTISDPIHSHSILFGDDSYETDEARKAIMRLLSPAPAPYQFLSEASRLEQIEPSAHAFHKTGDPLNYIFLGPNVDLPVTYEFKTVGTLITGGPFGNVHAMSGWSDSRNTRYINGRRWTDDVLHICTLIGHQLVPDVDRDRGVPGQYHASHAEKQLIAFLIDFHCFLDQEKLPGGSLHELARICPPVMLRKVTIVVSSRPCNDCLAFIDRVNWYFNLFLRVEERRTPDQSTRSRYSSPTYTPGPFVPRRMFGGHKSVVSYTEIVRGS